MFVHFLIIKKAYLPFLFCLLSITCRANIITIPDTVPPGGLKLAPYLFAWEDTGQSADATTVLSHMHSFVPLDSLRQGDPTDVYWLAATLTNASPIHSAGSMTAGHTPRVISFSHLTYVDLYLFQDDSCIRHAKAGAFRERSALSPGDGRLWLSLPPGDRRTYTLLLKVRHTKHYRPVFDFTLWDRETFLQHQHDRESVELRSQGAVWIFLLYTLVSWLVSRFRPYAWLLLFITGIALYTISTHGYFIEWFFPEHPATGWLFNIHFFHLGIFGLYMLIIDFWQVPKYNPQLYRLCKAALTALVLLSLVSFCIDYFTGNFNLMNTINLWASFLPLSFSSIVLSVCWRRLDSSQRYLAYGVFLSITGGMLITLGSAILHERSLSIAPYITNLTTVGVFILFSTGLKEALHQHEVAKQAALRELTLLQMNQNAILEKNVEERTLELKISNHHLTLQKDLLADRNARIETLINELSHRVKNNLQLLYSLISLQLPGVKDQTSRDILKGNIARIRAMMLVNQKLHRFGNSDTILLGEFVEELAAYLQQIYDTSRKVHITLDIPAGIRLNARHTLSFGLILSELLTNSFKYAFTSIAGAMISITICPAGSDNIRCGYADNGTGLKGKKTDKSSMGISLVRDLVRQMNGHMTIHDEAGLSYELFLPVPPKNPSEIA